MKTLFALLSGVVLGTVTALWLAARSFRDRSPSARTTMDTAQVDTPEAITTEEGLP